MSRTFGWSLLLSSLLMACGGPQTAPGDTPTSNTAPVAATVPGVTGAVGAPEVTLNLSVYFSDHEQSSSTLSYRIINSAPSVVTATVTGPNLTLQFLAAGTASLTIQATDSGGLSISSSLAVTVNPAVSGGVVTTLADTGPGSLRAVLQAAPAGAVITVTPGLTGKVTLSTPLYVNKSLTLDLNDLQLDGQGAHRILMVEVGNHVEIRNASLLNGLERDSSGNGAGGLIFNKGHLTLVNADLRAGQSGTGGLLFNASQAELQTRNVTFSGGQATWGGAIFNTGTATLTGGAVTDSHSGREGGGIRNEGTMTLDGARVSGNSAQERGGGVSSWGGKGRPASLTLKNETGVVGNRAEYGGGLYVNSAEAGSTLLIDGSTIEANEATLQGGGLAVLRWVTANLNNAAVRANVAPKGGGVYVDDYTSFTRTGGGVTGNSADNVYPPFRDVLPAPGVIQEWCERPVVYHAGTVYLENNNWNARSLPAGSSYDLCLRRRVTPAGDEQLGWRYTLPTGLSDVFLYPEVVYGWKPWQVQENTSPFLPARLDRLPEVTMEFDVDLVSTGSYNLAATAWLTTTAAQPGAPHPETVRYEVMFWYDHDATFPPPGAPIASVTAGGITYDLHTMPRSDGGFSWIYYAFVARGKVYKANVPIDELMQFLVARSYVPNTLYLANVELGTEARSGSLELWLNHFDVISEW